MSRTPLREASAELHPVPDSSDNDQIYDVVGNKEDTADGDSLVAITKNIHDVVTAGDHYEKVYPYDTAGISVTPGNQDWGETTVMIPIDGIKDDYGWDTGDIIAYNIVGFEYMLSAGANKLNTIQYMRVVKATAQVLDGNAAGAQAVIPVPLTGDFLVGDQVWIVDDDTAAGELREIESIITDTSITVTAALTGTYTTAQNAVVYLARRKGETAYRTIWDKFAYNTTKSMIRHELHGHRAMASGDGLIARVFGIDDAAGIMDITIIFHAEVE